MCSYMTCSVMLIDAKYIQSMLNCCRFTFDKDYIQMTKRQFGGTYVYLYTYNMFPYFMYPYWSPNCRLMIQRDESKI